MEAIEKKFDNILRRLSSKSRRATASRRMNRCAEDSSSGSDEDALRQQQMGTPKNDRKGGGSRRAHAKPMQPAVQSTGTTTTATKTATTTTAVATVESFSEQMKRAASNQQQQKQMSEREEHPKIGVQETTGNHTQVSGPLLLPPRLPSARIVAADSVTATAAVSSTAHDKSCESEDADYISDYSTCGVQRSTTRKSVNELDMSMDESLPESCGRESGYLSGIDIRYSTSAAESPALSPLGVTFARAQPLFQRTLETITQQSFDDEELHKKGKEILNVVAVPRRLGHAGGRKLQEEEAKIPDYESTERLLRDSIAETKYITTIFELSSGGIVGLIDDVLNEFNLWFREETGILGIACEVQWSVPEKHRHRTTEKRMKEALHHSLWQNNRRVLNMKSKTGNYQLPLTMISATTEENCARDCQLHCFQGVYRRFYTSLLPYQHTDTGAWHRPYWNLRGTNRPNPPKPNLKQFVFGRDATKFDKGSLVAVNVVALKVAL